MKAFFDATGSLWSTGALSGKPAAMLTSTASIGGGQESTIMASVPILAHHGEKFRFLLCCSLPSLHFLCDE